MELIFVLVRALWALLGWCFVHFLQVILPPAALLADYIFGRLVARGWNEKVAMGAGALVTCALFSPWLLL